jgi:hypothetical protein
MNRHRHSDVPGRRRPDLDRLEDAGLLGKAPLPEEPLPEELRGALGIRDDDPTIDADEDGEEYAGVGLFEE